MSTVVSAAPPPTDRLLLSREEAARLLALSPRTIDSLTRAGDLAAVRVGRRVLYSPDALRDLIARRQTS